MTVADLIARVLKQIREEYYVDRKTRVFRMREYKRDETALMKAIARYGYECDRRGWQFEALEIYSSIYGLLHQIAESKAGIQYLPLYLEGAVDRHIRTRAEELSAASKKLSNVTTKAIGKLEVKDVRQQTDVEVLATIYRDLKARKKRKCKAVAKVVQESLL